MRKLLLTLFVTIAFITTLSAQEKIPLINSGEIIQKGIELHNEGKYDAAIDLYKKVNRSDTNYVYALYELSLSYMASEKYKEGLQVIETAIAEKRELERLPDILTQYGSLTDNVGNPERALHIFDSALQIYPAYSMLYLNKGTTLMRMKKLKEAEAVFQQCILINPYSASSHFKLGLVSLQLGKLVPSMLSLMNYLLVTPEGDYSNNCIKILSSIAKNTDEISGYVQNRAGEPAEEYALAEQIIQSKIALEKKYKPIIKLDDPISRQLQVLLEKLEFSESSNDFWMQYYVPIYTQLFKSGKFEYLVNHMFSGVDLEQIKTFNKKNKKGTEAMVEEVVTYFNNIRSSRELMYNKRKSSETYYHYSNGVYAGKGKLNGDKFTGDWTFCYPGGNIKSRGRYNSNGDMDGEWNFYYHNGDLKVKVSYTNGIQNGSETYYFQNGLLSQKASYVNDKMEAEARSYYYSGKENVVANYKAGKLNGERRRYSRNGNLVAIENYANDKLNGNFSTFYANGVKESEGAYVDGELNGSYKAWHDNGILSLEAQYTKDKQSGTWKRYHRNGKLKSTQAYIEGVAEGDYEEFYNNGQLYTKYRLKKGKLSGEVNYYDEDGKLFNVFIFENDKPKSAKYFDKSGKEISSSAVNGNRFELTTYYPQGMRRSHVEYDAKGNAEGMETFYYHSGKTSQATEYHEGKINGTSTGYFANGKLSSVTNYKDDNKDGYCKTFFQHGVLQSEGWYRNNAAEGTWYNYDEMGNLNTIDYFETDDLHGHKEEFYENGKKEYDTRYHYGWIEEMTQYDTTGKLIHHVKMTKGNGKFSGIHLNGKIAFEGNYVQGQFEGAYPFYYFDGSKHVVQYYRKGELDSTYRRYHYGGQLNTEGKFASGKKTGTWKYYNRDGKLIYSEEYADGELNGYARYYFPNGKVELEHYYVDGTRNGLTKRYESNGNLVYQVRYKDDLQYGYSYMDKTGKLVPEIPIQSGNGKLKCFYANGNLATEQEFRDGKIVGPYKIYFANGKLFMERTDDYDMTNGPSKEYFENGQLKSVYNYLNDSRHGSYKEYNDKGIVREEGNCYNNSYHGEIKLFDDNGKLKETHIYYYGKLLTVKK